MTDEHDASELRQELATLHWGKHTLGRITALDCIMNSDWIGDFELTLAPIDEDAARLVEFYEGLKDFSDREKLSNEGKGRLPPDEDLDPYRKLLESADWWIEREGEY